MIHLAIKFVCLLGLLSGTSLLTQARPQYVEPAIKIGVFDSEGNPIDKPKVIVYDSLHRFVKEEVVNKTDFKGQIKKIEIQNFGTYYLQFSKEGYEPIEEVRVTWKNEGLTSMTYTLPLETAYWTLTRPVTWSSRAKRPV